MRRFVVPLSLVPALLAGLPAAADAATVQPGSGLNAAVQAAAPGETLELLAGTYSGAVTVPASKTGLKLVAAPGVALADVKLTGGGSGATLTVNAPQVLVRGVTIEVPANAGSAVVLGGAEGTLDGVSVSRTASSTDAPAVNATAGPATVTRSVVIQAPGQGTAPAVQSSSAQGLTVTDSLVAGVSGAALKLTAGASSKVQRATFFGLSGTQPTVDVSSTTSSGDVALTMDSTTVASGGSASGIRAATGQGSAGLPQLPPLPPIGVGEPSDPIRLDLRHVTVAGSTRGVELVSPNAAGLDAQGGTVTAVATSSILQGPDSQSPRTSLALADTDTTTPAAELFRNPARGDYRLKFGSPAIDTGGPLAEGESTTDLQGDPRTVGPKSDKGSDEFVNVKPVAVLDVSAKQVKQGETVTFSGARTTDGGDGSGIARYAFNFGDGSPPVVGTEPTVTHTYTKTGTFTPSLLVEDKGGLLSEPVAGAPVEVRDGSGPAVAVTSPKKGQKLALKPRLLKPRAGETKRRRSKAKPLLVTGSVSDDAGVKSVEVALRRGSAKGGTCKWFDGRRFVSRSCSQPVYRTAKLTDVTWSFKQRSSKLPKGSYTLSVRATDLLGNVSAPANVAAKTLVAFRIR